MQTSHECSVNMLRKQWLLVFSGSDYSGIRSESANRTCDGDKLPLICGVVENNAHSPHDRADADAKVPSSVSMQLDR